MLIAGLELVCQDLGVLRPAREHDGVNEGYADCPSEISHHVEKAAAVTDLVMAEAAKRYVCGRQQA